MVGPFGWILSWFFIRVAVVEESTADVVKGWVKSTVVTRRSSRSKLMVLRAWIFDGKWSGAHQRIVDSPA